jgi:transposase-like protein
VAAQRKRQGSEGKERFWRQIVEGHQGSQQTVREWCDRHSVSEPSFYAWRRELAKRDAARSEAALLPVTITSASLPAPVEIAWPGGVVVRVSAGCDMQLLRETLRVLQSLDTEAQPC